MSKTSERLETYQTQMSIYAEQHKIILASDVLDMIEQLQDDLKDDVDKVVAELEEMRMNYFLTIANTGSEKLDIAYGYASDAVNRATDIVKRGGVE